MVDSKLTALTALTTPAPEDLLYIVDDPSGTPAERKVTLADVFNQALKIIVKQKTADEIVNNSTTLQADDDLVFAGEANKTYTGIMFLYVETNATSDIKMNFSLPTGATGLWANDLTASSPRTPVDITTSETISIATGTRLIIKYFKIVMSSTAGNCTLQWAQDVAQVFDTKIYKGSLLVAWHD